MLGAIGVLAGLLGLGSSTGCLPVAEYGPGPTCDTDADCAQELVCDHGFCQPKPQPDAGTPDAATAP